MEILHVVQGYTPAVGGTELQIQRVSEELVSQFGDRVTVFTTDCYNAGGFVNPRAPRLPVGSVVINGVTVRRFHVINWAGPLLKPLQWAAFKLGLPLNQYLRIAYSGPHIPGLSAAIATFPADVMAAASFPLLHMFTALRAGTRIGRPVVLIGNQHPEDLWGYQRSMIDAAIREAGAYIAMTGFEAQYVIDRGAPPDRVVIVGSGVDPVQFATVDQREARFRLGLPQDKPCIGFIGQLGRYKGVETLLRAMQSVWQSVPQVHLVIAGAQTNYQNQLDLIINAWPPEYRQKISLHYNFDDSQKSDLFAALDVFAYPSLYESFGIAFLEAWSAGKPVVGCNRGAIPWVVQDKIDGVLVGYQDVQALAAALIDLVISPERARELGETGRKKVIARFTWPAIARCFREVYTSVQRS